MGVWKKAAAFALAGAVAVSMGGCGRKAPEEDVIQVTEAVEEELPAVKENTEIVSDLKAEISWWTYPVFVQDEGQEDGSYEKSLIAEFNKKYPNITVDLKLLDYGEGPDEIQNLIDTEGGELPDVLLDEPGRISSYAQKGLLSDIGSLFTEEVTSDMVSEDILSACKSGDALI